MKKGIFGTKAFRLFCFSLLFVCLTVVLSACSLFGGNVSNGTGLTNNTSSTSSGNKESASYNVTMHFDGYSTSDFFDSTGTIIKPKTDPVKTGYDFVRWCSDEECTTELAYGTKISSDLHIYIEWKIKTLTVKTVNTINEQEEEYSVTYNNKVTLPTPSEAGYEFLGWFSDSQATEEFNVSSEKITEDITLYTGWRAIAYDIHYTTNGGTLSDGYAQTYTRFSAQELPTCDKEGYEFVGWYDNADLEGNVFTEIAKGQYGEKSFYAKYVCLLAEAQPKSGSVNFEEGVLSFPIGYHRTTIDLEDYIVFSENATVKIFTEENEGVLSNWIMTIVIPENEGETSLRHVYYLQVTSEKGTTTPVVYRLEITQYTNSYVTVSYYDNEATPTVVYKRPGEHAETPDEPEAETGYRFEYWAIGSVDGEEFDFDTIITDDISLYAHFSAIVYNISYSLGYGQNDEDNPATYTVEDAGNFEDALPTSEEYTFEGWYDDSAYTHKVTALSDVIGGVNDAPLNVGNVTLYARYMLTDGVIKDFSDAEEIEIDDLDDYFLYIYFNRIETISVVVTGGEEGVKFGDYFDSASGQADFIDGAEGCRLTSDSGLRDLEADENGRWSLTGNYRISIEYHDLPTLFSSQAVYPQVSAIDSNYAETGRDPLFNDFAIDHVADCLEVVDTEQLVFAVEHGYRPLPDENSKAEEVYNEAKAVLRTIVNDDMSDFEKALAIYDYVIYNVSYDHYVFDHVKSGEITAEDAVLYKCFYLDGVFDEGVAVCDGYSKAFMLLCRIEGLRVYQVEGYAYDKTAPDNKGSGHAWNKIRLAVDGGEREWYVVDCTSGDSSMSFAAGDNRETMSHAFFLYSDTLMDTRDRTNEGDETVTFEATEEGDSYSYFGFTFEDAEYSYKISNDAQMIALMKYLITNTPSTGWISVDFALDVEYDPFDEHGFRSEIINGVGVMINSCEYLLSSVENFDSHTIFCRAKSE